MDENVKEQDVLLVKEKDNDKLQVLAGTDEKGKLKTVPPTQENEPDFLKIDKGGTVLENFLSNLTRQYKDPTHFQFFKVPVGSVGKTIVALQEMFKNPETNKEAIENSRFKTEDFGQKKAFQPIDESRIDWKQLERLGVTKEILEKTGSLDSMLKWQKSPILIPIVGRFDDITLKTDVRLSFKENSEGKITLGVHAWQNEPELRKPYFGVKFTDKDVASFRQTGNLGRIANAEYKPGELTPVYLSVDKLTNELVAARADRIKIPTEFLGVKLDDMQQKFLKEGKGVYLEGLTTTNGKTFNATLQADADRKGLGLRYTEAPNIQTGQSKQQEQSQSGQQGYFIPKKLGGVELSGEQHTNLKEGGTIYVNGMTDKKGELYNAYVKFDFEEGKPKFYQWNPDKVKEVTPDNAARTQVAVNSDGKTNEATRNVKEPLASGQTKPTEQQKAKEKENKEEKKEEPKKSKGHKIS
ncbi:MAG: DUF3945 domain-containing protein [Mariniphaga sp.]|nr:DUF3945 domain-containing protein [Mariniphaga sp.]